MKLKSGLIYSLGLLASLAGAPALGEEEAKAVVITDVARPVSCIAPVAIQQIDGQEVQVSSQRFEIEAGDHTMTGRAQLDFRYCPEGSGRRNLTGRDSQAYPPLEGHFEAGMKYFVGFDHSSPERESWGLKVWKVEQQ